MSAFAFFFDLCRPVLENANVTCEHHHLLPQKPFLTFWCKRRRRRRRNVWTKHNADRPDVTVHWPRVRIHLTGATTRVARPGSHPSARYTQGRRISEKSTYKNTYMALFFVHIDTCPWPWCTHWRWRLLLVVVMDVWKNHGSILASFHG